KACSNQSVGRGLSNLLLEGWGRRRRAIFIGHRIRIPLFWLAPSWNTLHDKLGFPRDAYPTSTLSMRRQLLITELIDSNADVSCDSSGGIRTVKASSSVLSVL